MTPELGSVAAGTAVGVRVVAENAVEGTNQMVSVQQFEVWVRGQRRKSELHPDLILEQDPGYEKSAKKSIQPNFLLKTLYFLTSLEELACAVLNWSCERSQRKSVATEASRTC